VWGGKECEAERPSGIRKKRKVKRTSAGRSMRKRVGRIAGARKGTKKQLIGREMGE
jgi:hypothetical protein